MMKPNYRSLSAMLAASVLVACGGGGSSTPPPVVDPPPPPPPPELMTITNDPTDLAGRGLWGSVVLSGYGEINNGDSDNQTTTEAVPDGVTRWFGGADNADSSGLLRYVIIAESGEGFRPDEEIQGLTIEAAGGGTEISYLQVVNSDDDGVEWFGGAASADHLLIQGVADDSLDMDLGYQGSLQYVLVVQGTTVGDQGIESDGNGSDFGALPKTAPIMANLTILGNGGDGGTADLNTAGALHREGFGGQVYRSVYSDDNLAGGQFDVGCLDLDDEVDEDLFYGDVVLNCAAGQFVVDSDTFHDDFAATAAFDAEIDNTLVIDAGTLAITATYTATGYSAELAAAGLDDTAYVGAVDPGAATAWWENWALRDSGIEGNLPGGDFHPLEAEITGSTIAAATTNGCEAINADFEAGADVEVFGMTFPVCVISEAILDDTTLTNDHVYLLDGSINVGDGDLETASDATTVTNVALAIEAGTQIFGITGTGPALVITRGSTIEAEGTEAMPIIFGAVEAELQAD